MPRMVNKYIPRDSDRPHDRNQLQSMLTEINGYIKNLKFKI